MLEALEKTALGYRPDPSSLLETTGSGSRTKLSRCLDLEVIGDLQHPLRPETQIPSQADQVWTDVAFELVQLRDRARFHELGQRSGYGWADTAQFANSVCTDKFFGGCESVANRLGGTPVGARGVKPGTGQLQETGERIQPLSDRLVTQRR